MKRALIYLDTSVFGAICDEELPHRIRVTKALFTQIENGKFECCVSDLVLLEIQRAPQPIRDLIEKIMRNLDVVFSEETEISRELSNSYLQGGAFPASAEMDARHLALAVVRGVDFVVSWNYRHLVNVKTIHTVNSINLRLGYRTIEIFSPEEVVASE